MNEDIVFANYELFYIYSDISLLESILADMVQITRQCGTYVRIGASAPIDMCSLLFVHVVYNFRLKKMIKIIAMSVIHTRKKQANAFFEL